MKSKTILFISFIISLINLYLLYPLLFKWVIFIYFIGYNVIILLYGGWFIFSKFEMYYHLIIMRKLERATKKMQLMKINSNILSSQKLTPNENYPVLHKNKVLVDLSQIIQSEYKKPLLETIKNYSRILVVGGMGSGKTTIMMWLAYLKSQLNNNIIVIDTHSYPRKWPLQSYVLGIGCNYEMATKGFEQLLKVMDSRYQAIGKGHIPEGKHPPISFISDEWSTLPDMIPNFSTRYVKPLFTQSRKASINLCLATHDTTVDVLGMEGISGLKKSFDVIVWCSCQGNEYITDISYGFKVNSPKEKCQPPGPYNPKNRVISVSNNKNDFRNIPGILSADIPILECMRANFNKDVGAIMKVETRKKLGLQPNKSSYEILENIAEKYNLKLL